MKDKETGRQTTTGARAEHMRHVGRRAEPHMVLKYAGRIKETGGKMTKMEILPSEHRHPAARCLISHKNQREETFFGGLGGGLLGLCSLSARLFKRIW